MLYKYFSSIPYKWKGFENYGAKPFNVDIHWSDEFGANFKFVKIFELKVNDLIWLGYDSLNYIR